MLLDDYKTAEINSEDMLIDTRLLEKKMISNENQPTDIHRAANKILNLATYQLSEEEVNVYKDELVGSRI